MKVFVTFFITFTVALILLGIFTTLFRVVLYPAKTATNMVDLAYDANNKVVNADNAIYNYEWFKQKFQDIQASKAQLENARKSYNLYVADAGDRMSWSFEDKTEAARLNAVVLGLENNTQSLIADYNARASMATRNIFEDHVLPNYIDALTFIRK